MKHAKKLVAATAISLSSILMSHQVLAEAATQQVDPAWAAKIAAALTDALPDNNPAYHRESVAGQSIVVRIQIDESGNVTTFEPVSRMPSLAMRRVFRKTRKNLETLPAYPGGKASFHAELGYDLDDHSFREPHRGFAMVE